MTKAPKDDWDVIGPSKATVVSPRKEPPSTPNPQTPGNVPEKTEGSGGWGGLGNKKKDSPHFVR